MILIETLNIKCQEVKRDKKNRVPTDWFFTRLHPQHDTSGYCLIFSLLWMPNITVNKHSLGQIKPHPHMLSTDIFLLIKSRSNLHITSKNSSKLPKLLASSSFRIPYNKMQRYYAIFINFLTTVFIG